MQAKYFSRYNKQHQSFDLMAIHTELDTIIFLHGEIIVIKLQDNIIYKEQLLVQ